jgi:hypothetical protein
MSGCSNLSTFTRVALDIPVAETSPPSPVRAGTLQKTRALCFELEGQPFDQTASACSVADAILGDSRQNPSEEPLK